MTPDTPLSKLLTEALTLEQSMRDQASISATLNEGANVCLLSDPNEEESECYVNAMRRTKKNVNCSHCGSNDHTSYERREKCPAWGKKCNNCQILHHFKSMCLKPKRTWEQRNPKSVEFAEILFIGEASSSSTLLPVEMRKNADQHFVSVDVFPDTGANICLMGPAQLRMLKIKPSNLHPCREQIAVAGGSTIMTTGWVRVTMKLEKRITETAVYYSKRAKRLFLSRNCCRKLNIIPESFPYPPLEKLTKGVADLESGQSGSQNADNDHAPIY